MNPADVLREEPPRPMRPRPTSPATHLAKLRRHKKLSDQDMTEYETALNRYWRTVYMNIYHEENAHVFDPGGREFWAKPRCYVCKEFEDHSSHIPERT